MSVQDLNVLIGDWDYDPDRVSVRRIVGVDGELKLQMRIDLGVLQVQYRGRPDGQPVEGKDSHLEAHRDRLSRYVRRCGASLGFTISTHQCELLREEMMQFYQRIVCLFVLDAYDEAIADLDHCRAIIELCVRFGEDKDIVNGICSMTPHLVLMQTKAITAKLLATGDVKAAFDQTLKSVCDLLNHYCANGTIEDYHASPQVDALERMRLNLATKLSADDRTILRRSLRLAIKEERFEEAAQIRDELRKLGA